MRSEQLAKECGVSVGTIYNIARRLGRFPTKDEVVLRAKGRPQKYAEIDKNYYSDFIGSTVQEFCNKFWPNPFLQIKFTDGFTKYSEEEVANWTIYGVSSYSDGGHSDESATYVELIAAPDAVALLSASKAKAKYWEDLYYKEQSDLSKWLGRVNYLMDKHNDRMSESMFKELGL